jgi:hypothetical protein
MLQLPDKYRVVKAGVTEFPGSQIRTHIFELWAYNDDDDIKHKERVALFETLTDDPEEASAEAHDYFVVYLLDEVAAS